MVVSSLIIIFINIIIKLAGDQLGLLFIGTNFNELKIPRRTSSIIYENKYTVSINMTV